MRRLVLALILVPAISCGGSVKQVPSTPTIIAGADQNLRAAAIKALGILESAGLVTQKALAVYNEAAKQAPLPAEVDSKIRAGFNQAATAALTAIKTIDSGATDSWAKLKAAIDPVLGRVNELIAIVNTITTPQQRSLSDWLQLAVQVISSALALVPRTPALEGV